MYLLLALPVGLYTCLVHVRWLRASEHGTQALGEPAKEAAVALLFTAAVAAPAWTAALPQHRAALLVAAGLLTLLCWINCAIIGLYESPASALAAPWQRQRNRLGAASLLLALAALLTGCAFLHDGAVGSAAAAAAISLSAPLMLWLLFSHRADGAPLSPRRVRVLADLALLTPLFLLPLVSR